MLAARSGVAGRPAAHRAESGDADGAGELLDGVEHAGAGADLFSVLFAFLYSRLRAWCIITTKLSTGHLFQGASQQGVLWHWTGPEQDKRPWRLHF